MMVSVRARERKGKETVTSASENCSQSEIHTLEENSENEYNIRVESYCNKQVLLLPVAFFHKYTLYDYVVLQVQYDYCT
jgi:hypothetical protein